MTLERHTMTAKTRDGDARLTETWLVQLIAEQLGIDEALVPTDRPIGEMGIDSLTAAQISAVIEDRIGTTVPLQRFLGEETLATLVAAMAEGKLGTDSGGAPGTTT